jgi:flagellar biosynthesis/type III secretory pathway protein FliH
MTTLGRARIVTGNGEAPPEEALVTPERRHRMLREEADAREAAVAIRDSAVKEARAIVDKARTDAANAALAAADEAREAEHARLAALVLAMKHQDEKRADRDLDRVVELAIVLSERLLGEALVQEPGRVVALARQALAEARGARRAVIEASPLDAELLQHHLDTVGFSPHTVELRHDSTLARGSLRITTNLGTLDAQLRPQLERLAATLKDALRGP